MVVPTAEALWASSSRPAFMEVSAFPPQPDSGGCSLGKAPLSLPVLAKTAIAGCEVVLALGNESLPFSPKSVAG